MKKIVRFTKKALGIVSITCLGLMTLNFMSLGMRFLITGMLGGNPSLGLCMAVLMGMLAWFFGFCTREVYRGTFPKKAKE